jgi:ketosteroid isomerase-like protein
VSDENVTIVIKIFEDTNSRDFAAVMNAYAEDVVLVLHGDLGAPTTATTGKADVGEWFGDWFRQFGPSYRFDIEESRGSGDRVFLVATHHGHGRTSGVPVEQRTAYVYTVLEGEVTRIEVWRDRNAALEVFEN